jgi:Zn-dependent peptidase ImmA (M78 family)
MEGGLKMGRFAKSYSDVELRKLASALRSYFGTANSSRVDILVCLRTGFIWTIRGIKRLIYEICPDDKMGADDAQTEYHGDAITIRVKSSVHAAAAAGMGRARFTLAHELGHAVLHDGMTRARHTGTVGSQTRKWEKAYEAPERQANIFAISFLVNDPVAETLSSAMEISDRFGISLEAATYYFNSIVARRGRAESVDRVLKKAAAFREQKIVDPVLSVAYRQDACPICGQCELIQNGPKYTCMNCGRTGDHFQDGDRLNGE